MWQKVLALALLGACGTLARYALSGLVQRAGIGLLPWGTLAVNVTGCLLFGLVWALAEERLLISGQMRALVLIGFFGAFTTFSTFAFETGQLIRDSEWLYAGGNLLLQNSLGMIAIFAGVAIGRSL